MKKIFLLLVVALAFASCSTTTKVEREANHINKEFRKTDKQFDSAVKELNEFELFLLGKNV